MPKERLTCRDCIFCQAAAGMSICLCWRDYDGPQVQTIGGGVCGDQVLWEEGDEQMSAPEAWVRYHERPASALKEIATLLRLAVAGAGS